MDPITSSSDWVDLSPKLDPVLGFRLTAYPVVDVCEGQNDSLFGKRRMLVFEPQARAIASPRRVFERFLEARTEEQLIDLAKRMGALGLCGHGLPAMHPWLQALGKDGRYRVASGNPDFCSPWTSQNPKGGQPVAAESVAAWQAWAENARALCGIAASHYSRRASDPRDEEILRDPKPPFRLLLESAPELREVIQNSNDLWRLVGVWLNVWFSLSRVEIHAGLFRDGLRLELFGRSSLLGYLATSLASAVTRRPGLGFCSGCGVPFFPKRRQSGRSSYCDSCGVRAAWRDSKRRKRQR